MELLTGVNDHGRRLDRILRKALPSCPLPLIHKLLRKGLILVNGKPAGAQTRVVKGSKISIPRLAAGRIAKKSIKNEHPQMPKPVIIPAAKPKTRPALAVRFYHPPEILWQGCGLIAFNKPAGLAVHGQVSLDKMVQAYLVNKLPPSLSFKPGPLHRLDKPSSGIVVFSASLEGANHFSSLMKEHKIKKTYMAIVEGVIKERHFWTDYLIRDKEKKISYIYTAQDASDPRFAGAENKKGKIAITLIEPVASASIKNRSFTLIKAEIETGRTHQIRAQSAFHGHPLAGDCKYGGSVFYNTQKNIFFLHAQKMEFTAGGVEHKIEAPLPAEFQRLADRMFKL